MSHHVATVQLCFEKAATTYDAALTITDRIYQIDETYVQPFYRWIAPRLQDAALSGLCWALIALFDIAHWLNDVTQHYMTINAHSIALHTFAQDHDPLPEIPALYPATVTLALPATKTQGLTVLPFSAEEFWAATFDVIPEVTLISATPAPLALCPATVPLSLHSTSEYVDPGYTLLTTILDSGFFSGAAQPITQSTPLIVSVAVAPTKTPSKTRKPKKNQAVADAPVTAQAGSRKRSQRNGAKGQPQLNNSF